MNDNQEQNPITRTQVAQERRMAVTSRLFGYDFPLKIEPMIFNIATDQATNYQGGYWEFYTLDNGGFYMAPAGDEKYQMSCPNMFEGELSGDALGIVACLCAYSHLSFSQDLRFAKKCAEHFHWLRAYALYHPEVAAIFAAID